jgi:peptide/nickel transport system substrate-binding protein
MRSCIDFEGVTLALASTTLQAVNKPARHRHPVRAAFLGFLLSALLFAFPAGSPRAAELTIGISQFPSNLHPMIDSMLAKTYVLAATRRPVTLYDHDWKLVCFLCVELPSLENGGAQVEALADGGEGIAVTYRLHPDATWGDGTPVTSDDIVFAWEVGRHPESGVTNLEAFRRILAIDVIDKKSFTVHLDRVIFDYNALGLSPLPRHLEEEIFLQDPASYRNRTLFDRAPDNPGLAFGPYRISEVASGSHIVLVPNSTWYGKTPAFGKITVKAIENTAALEANLLSGAIDMIAGELGLSLDQALAFEKRHGDRFQVLYKPGLIYEHLDLMLDNPILADSRVREALLLALDRETISARLFEGRQPPAHSQVSPLDWVADPGIRRHGFDPERARALLEEAGWRPGADGLRRDESGELLRIELMTTAGNRSRELVQQVLQSQWKDVGVDAVIRNEPARVFFGETVSKRKFSGAAMFAWISSPESVPRTTLHSEQIPSEENAWSGQNYTGYRNEEMDRLIDAIERELDPEKRRALWVDLQNLYAADLPALPLYWRANAFILPRWLEGVRPTGHQGTTTLWIEDWRDTRR